jgi:acetone carboxylase gamma subunit
MKKFILASVFVVAASSMFADDAAPKVDAPKSSWFNMPSISCPVCVKNATHTVEAKMIAHPWYSAAAVAVTTFLVVKAVDYALENEDEEAGF